MAINAIRLTGGMQGEGVVAERLAAASNPITPGMLLQVNSAGTVSPHATAASNAQKIFALDNLANGDPISTAYAVSTLVRHVYAVPGMEIYGLVAASASAIVIGDALESAGDGTVRKAATDASTDTVQRDAIVGYATMALDNSGGGSVARLSFRVA